MDHRLKSIYEQMLKGNVTKQSSKEQPRNLTEAYTKIVLTERTAFYAKDIAAGEEIPDIQGLESLGDVENPEKIKHAITSYSLLKPLEELLILSDEAGKGWHKPPVVGIKLNDLGQEFVSLGITGNFISKLVSHKNSLTDLESKVKSGKEFIMKDVVLDNLNKIENIGLERPTLEKLYNYLFPMTANIALAAVGAGEICATLLTNAKKGIIGDLVFGEQKVEIKGLNGRVGKAGYAWKNTAKGLADFLISLQRSSDKEAGKETPTSVKFKNNIRAAFNQIRQNETLAKFLDERYLQLIANFIKERNLIKLEKAIANSNILTVPSSRFLRDFIKDTDPNFPLTPTPPPESAVKFFVDQNDKIKTNLKQILSSVEQLSKEEDIADPKFLATQNYSLAVRYFFMHDIGLTAEQAAEAFIKHAKTGDIDNNVAMRTYGPAITNFFATHYNSLKEGNVRLLKALIFGYSLAIYARNDGNSKHFNYFLMINDRTQEAIAVNTTVPAGQIVTDCVNLFMSNSKLSLDITADERGGSKISFGKDK